MKLKIVPASLCLVCLLFAGCSPKTPIKIGFIGTLSGDKSQLGVYARTAATIAVDEINRQGGVINRNLILISRDNKGRPALQEQLIDDLVDQGAQLIVGPLLSAMMPPTLEALSKHDVLVISPTVSTDLVSGLEDNFLRMNTTASENGRYIGRLLLQEPAQKRVAVIYDVANKEYAETFLEGFFQVVSGNGKNLVFTGTLEAPRREYLQMARELIRSEPDAVVLITNSADSGMLAQQLRKLHSTAQLYGSLWTKTGKLIETGGLSVEGMLFADILKTPDPSGRYARFEEEVRDSYHQELDIPHSFTYDAVMILAEAIRVSKSIDPGVIKKTILETSAYETYNGKISFDMYGDVVREFSTVRIQNGRFVAEKTGK